MVSTLELRVITANIQNFNPNLTAKQVVADLTTVKGMKPDLVLWQEIGQKQDFDSIIDVFGNDAYGTTDTGGTGGRSNVITWKRDALPSLGGSKAVRIGPGMGAGSHTPDQWMAKMSFRPEGFPQVDVYCIHFIQGAFSKPGQPGDLDGRRKKAWQSDWDHLRDAVLTSVKNGHIAIFGGDWNRVGKDIPKFNGSQRWIVQGTKGIDHVGLILPEGYEASTKGAINEDLNSDHNAKGIVLTVKKAAQPLAPNVQKAVDLMADARGVLRDMGTAKAKESEGHLQKAINTLYGV